MTSSTSSSSPASFSPVLLQRTTYCGHVESAHEGQTVRLCGWLTAVRNFGHVIFLVIKVLPSSFPSREGHRFESNRKHLAKDTVSWQHTTTPKRLFSFAGV